MPMENKTSMCSCVIGLFIPIEYPYLFVLVLFFHEQSIAYIRDLRVAQPYIKLNSVLFNYKAITCVIGKLEL